jgi:hypothetical protein
MARRRRPGARTSVADGRAAIIIPLESIIDPDGNALTFRGVSRWMRRVGEYPSPVGTADASVALVLDRFAWDLHLADIGHATDTHDGDTFYDAALSTGTVTIYVVSGLDPRRSKPDEINTAAAAGDVAGALVKTFAVDALQP